MQPEEAFALLQRILSSQGWNTATLSVAASSDSENVGLSISELLEVLDAACWKTLDPERCQTTGDHGRATCPTASSPPMQCSSESSGSAPVRVRYSQLYRGMEEAIAERQSTLASLTAALERTIQSNNELPNIILQREGECKSFKDEFMATSAQALGCDDVQDPRSRKNEASSVAAAVDDRVRALRRRKDLRAWACDELRSAINDHMTRASELKKEIATVMIEVKKEDQAHKAKTKRVEAILAATSSAHRSRTNGGPSLSPKELVTQAQERKTYLLDAIEQRKARLRSRTEEVFVARSDAEILEQKRAAVAEKIGVLEHEIVHVQRSCTPRPNWSELLEAALVTTAVDRVGKKTKLRIENSRKKVLGGAGTRHDDSEDQDDGGDQRLRQILTGNWSTIEKIHAMSEELTRIRSKYHAGDTILVEQARLDHLQDEISRTLQQLDAIRAEPSE